MNSRLLLMALLSFLTIIISYAQDVNYYKLTRKVINGISSTDVSGGQYITFISDICYESNNKGIDVGNGTMKHNIYYSTSEYTTYFGSSYWGNNASFRFKTDKSVLNVLLDNGDVYVYKRTTPPANQETCSLIRKPLDGETIIITPTPIYTDPNNPAQPQPDNTKTGGTTPSTGKTAHQVTKMCPLCHGSGKCNTCNGKHWYDGIGGSRITCPNCKPNGACSKCGGSGQITVTEWY